MRKKVQFNYDLFLWWSSVMMSSGDIGRAVKILSSCIQQIDLISSQLWVIAFVCRIVNNRCIWPNRWNWAKAKTHEIRIFTRYFSIFNLILWLQTKWNKKRNLWISLSFLAASFSVMWAPFFISVSSQYICRIRATESLIYKSIKN